MIPPLIYSSDKYKSFAEDLASSIGTTSSDEKKMIQRCHLYLSETGLSFFHPEARSTKKFKIDFNSGTTRWRTNRADHEKLIKKALGKQKAPLNILDCTAGTLQDSLLFLSLGHKVTAVEQSKILFYLLNDAIDRSNDQKIFKALTLVNANACSYISKRQKFDVIYFDPMYPSSKKNALGSGQLEYITRILDTESIENDSIQDFQRLSSMPLKKMIVKRPIKAEPFSQKINYKVLGKTTRFDIYI